MTAQTRIVELPPDGLTDILEAHLAFWMAREDDKNWLLSKRYITESGVYQYPTKSLLMDMGVDIVKETHPLFIQTRHNNDWRREICITQEKGIYKISWHAFKLEKLLFRQSIAETSPIFECLTYYLFPPR